MDEFRSMLSHSFQTQLRELREFCETMRSDSKDELQRFLECSEAVQQVAHKANPELRLAGHACSRVTTKLNGSCFAPTDAETCHWSKPSIIPAHNLVRACDGHAISAAWYSNDLQLQSIDPANKDILARAAESRHTANGIPSRPKLPGLVDDSDEQTARSHPTEAQVRVTLCRTSMPSVMTEGAMAQTTSVNSMVEARRGSALRMSNRSNTTKESRRTRRKSISNMLTTSRKRHQLMNDLKGFSSEGEPSERSDAKVVSCCFRQAQSLVSNPFFDYGMGVLLFVNAATMGIGVNTMAVNGLGETPAMYRLIDLVFNCIFTMELILRVVAFRGKFFKGEMWRWNVFDAAIVTLGWTHAFIEVVFQMGESMGDAVGLLRVLRLGRIARLIRMVRLIPELKSMVYLIMASMSSFFWAVVLMMMGVYFMAVYFTELASDMVQKGQVESIDKVKQHWGSVFQSSLSLYMSITGGDDWRNFVDPFKAQTAQYMMTILIFAVYIAFATLVMLNLVTGVFVEGAQRIIKEEKDTEVMNMAVKVFLNADEDDSQDITLEEWVDQLNTGSLDEYIRAVGLTRDEATRLFELLDQDGSGTINIIEFVRGCLRLRGPAKAMDMAVMLHDMKKQNVEAREQIMTLKVAVEAMVESPGIRRPHNRGQAQEPHDKETAVLPLNLVEV